MKNKRYLFTASLFFTVISIGFTAGRSWYQKAHNGGDARHRCTAFSIGNKGYYGGGHVNSGTTINYKDYWEYDPATNSWTQIADFGGGLRYHSSAFTIDGVGYVGCGEDDESVYRADFWKYIPEVNTWFPVSSLPAVGRRGGVSFTLNGKGYYGTGQSLLGYHSDFYVYDPLVDEWDTIASMPGEPRNAAVAFSYEGKGYVGTGHKVGEALNDFYSYDPLLDEWEVKANVGGSVRQDAMGFCIDGKGYIGTGNDDLGNDFDDIWEYNFETDVWTQIEDFTGQKRRYAVTFIVNNIPYLAGGTDGTNFKDLWAYAPSVSLNEIPNNSALKCYPNPSNDFIQIQFSNPPENGRITVQALNGQIIYQKSGIMSSLKLNQNEIGKGMFLMTLEDESGNLLAHQKIIFY